MKFYPRFIGQFISFCLLTVLATSFGGYAQSPRRLSFTITPYLQFADQHSIRIMWEASEPAAGRVEFEKARPAGDTVLLRQNRPADGLTAFHEVVLDGLDTECKYFYRVVVKDAQGRELRSAAKTFQTAVKDSSAFTFAIVGDTQNHEHDSMAWHTVSERIWEQRPDFVLHAGDVVRNGDEKEDWVNEYFGLARNLLSQVPVYTVLGNHDHNAPYYYQYMSNPAPEYYYTFFYGNAQFFMVDSDHELTPGSLQYNWLEEQLAASTAQWKFVVHHHPPYSSDENDFGDTHKMLAETGHQYVTPLIELYERYGVDMVFYGHIHSYERSWPVKKGKAVVADGVIYIQTGGGGGELEHPAPTRSWFTASLKTDHHFCQVSVLANQLEFKAIDQKGQLFDYFKLTKEEKQYRALASGNVPQAPILRVPYRSFVNETAVTIKPSRAGEEVRYTTDGSEPNVHSTLYRTPFTIYQSCTVKARTFVNGHTHPEPAVLQLEKRNPLPAVSVKHIRPGLSYMYFEDTLKMLPLPDTLSLVRKGICTVIGNAAIDTRSNYYALKLDGYIDIKQEDLYRFYTNTGDGSLLFIDGQLLVDNNGSHAPTHEYGEIALQKGLHHIQLQYFQDRGSQGLEVGLESATIKRRELSAVELFHAAK